MNSLKLVVLAGLVVLVVGCSGASDDAPTNTKNSKYIDTGQTAADKVGGARLKAHQKVMENGGQAPSNSPAPAGGN